jgi:hypothetical protein
VSLELGQALAGQGSHPDRRVKPWKHRAARSNSHDAVVIRQGFDGDFGFSWRAGLRLMTVVGGFDLCGVAVVEVTVEPFVVEPCDPYAGRDLEIAPRSPLRASAAGLRCSSVLNNANTDSAIALS